MIYGYARVSTRKQADKGNSLKEQEEQLRSAGAQTIIREAYTGTSMERPEFTKLMNRLQPSDTLIVTKLDRFARTLIDGVMAVQALQERGVTVNILNLGVIDSTPTGTLILNIFLSFAQFERSMILERTREGKEAARAKGIRVDGRPPKYSAIQMNHAIDLLATHSYTQVARMTGISKSTLTREKRRRIGRSNANEEDKSRY